MKKEAFILLTVILTLFFFANIVYGADLNEVITEFFTDFKEGITNFFSTLFGIEEKPLLAPPLPGIWISQAEIQALPTSGTAWNNMKGQADTARCTPALSNQDDGCNVKVLAKALVYAKLGQQSYRDDVVYAIQSIVNSGTYSGRALALGRELGAYVVSADLIDLKNLNPTLDNQFRIKIRELLTTPTSSGPSSLVDCHENRPNNWGTHCGFSRAAVASYLGDTTELARTAQVFIGWLGNRASYAGFTYGDLSWQCNPAAPVGINPLGCTKDGHNIDGVLPDDQRRGGSFSWPPPNENYVYEGLQGALAQAVVLQRAGYDIFNAENKALLRSFIWLHNVNDFPATGDDTWEPWIVNNIYGTSFPAPSPTSPGKNVGWTDWTHSQVSVPPPPDTQAPIISNIQNISITNTSATILWDTNEFSTTLVRYGTTPGVYTNSITGSSGTTHSITLTGLNPLTRYYYVVSSTDNAGNSNQSTELNFLTITGTQDTTPPVISNIQNTSITSSSALITWLTDEPSTTLVKYGTTPGVYTNSITGSSGTTHSITLSSLNPSTTYYYVVNSTDNSGNSAQSPQLNFITSQLPTGSILPTQIHLSTQTGNPSTEFAATWKTNITADSNLRYGTSPGVYTNILNGIQYSPSMSGSIVCCFHAAQATNLVPDTTYYYQVGGPNTGWSTEFTFKTAPNIGSQQPFTFVAYGDHGVTLNSRAVAAAADAENPSFVLHAGDITYCSTQNCVDTYFSSVINELASGSLYMASMGNHEYSDPNLATYIGRFNYPNAPIGTFCPSGTCSNITAERWYSFNWGNAHIVAIDLGSVYDNFNLDANPNDPRLVWLRNDLNAARANPGITWIIAYTHFPPYTSGTKHGSDTADRAALEPIFNTYKVDVVFEAHDHSYERTLPVSNNGASIDTTSCGSSPWATCTNPLYTIYILQGTGGQSLSGIATSGIPAWSIVRQNSYYGYNRVIINGNKLRASSKDASGNIRDDVTIIKSVANDTQAPIISNIQNTSIFSTSATISWITDEFSTTLVKYGTTPGVYTNSITGSSGTSHTITLSSLNPSTRYYYVVSSTDNAGNSAQSLEHNFITTAIISGTVSVIPTVETGPSHHIGDTADDSVIWIHPTDTSLSLVIGDDKNGGLMVYGLDGIERQYVDGTLYNNVDLRYNFPLAGQFSGNVPHQTVSLVGVGDEGGQAIDFFKVNPSTRMLEPAGTISTGTFIPYGSCMYHSPITGKYYYFVNAKSGINRQYELFDAGTGNVGGALVREFDVGTQTEGCVADDILGHFYIGEERVGIWKYGAEPSTGSTRTQVDKTGTGGNLVADVEGMSIYYTSSTSDAPNSGYLIASSQGNSIFAVYTREGNNNFLGKFNIIANGSIDAVSGTDGIDVTNFPLGNKFPQGLFVAHDNSNSGATASNYKYVPWERIANALGLIIDSSWDPRLIGIVNITKDTTPPIISNIQNTSIFSTSATILWTTDESSTTLVKYGTTPGVYTNQITGSSGTSHTITLSSLNPSTRYYYVVNSTDNSGNSAQSTQLNFLTLSGPPDTTPPIITNIQNISITNTSATILWDTNEFSTTLVRYGTTPGVYTNSITGSSGTSHLVSLSGINPSTTYYYVVSSTDNAGNSAQSSEHNFLTLSTPPPDTQAPIISNIQNTSITSSSALITWLTDESSTTLVKYGTTPGVYTNQITGTSGTGHTITLSGLNPSTRYYFVVNSTDNAGNSAQSLEHNFLTLSTPPPDTTPPIISNIQNTSITDTSATILWTTDEFSTTLVRYGTTPGVYTNSITGSSGTSHLVSLSGLNPSTTYYYVVNSTDNAGNSAQSLQLNFRTLGIAPVCTTSDRTWKNIPQTTQTGKFTWEFDATPLKSNTDVVTGLSFGQATIYTQVAVITRFFTNNLIETRNGGTYTYAASPIPYTPGITYHFRFEIDIPSHRYDAYVRSGTGSEQVLASNFAFRTEQASVTSLNNLTIHSSIVGHSHTVCNVVVQETVTDLPPIISNIQTPLITDTSALITWTTNEDSTTLVKYGTTSGSYTNIITGSSGTTHSILLTGFDPATRYFYQIDARDNSGQTAQSPENSFITLSTSTCTTNCVFTIPLSTGINLISLPLIPTDYSIPSIFGTELSKVRNIYAYDSLTGWKIYHSNPLIPSSLTRLNPKEAYFVVMKSPTSISIRGDHTYANGTLPTRTLNPGWNLIGIHDLNTIKLNDELRSIIYGSAWAFDIGYGYQEIINTTTYDLVPGKGYWVFVT